MLTQKRQDQRINVLSQTDYLPILIASFLTDRKSQGFADKTVKFYLPYSIDVMRQKFGGNDET